MHVKSFLYVLEQILEITYPQVRVQTSLQQDLVRQLESPQLVVADTRDLWINTQRDALLEMLGMVHGVVLNDAEVRSLTDVHNLVLAGRRMLRWGPQFVVIKKGEHGVMLVTKDEVVVLPAYPTTEVKDPTGAGDSFAGGMMGYLAAQREFSVGALKQALACGTITASFAIEDFSLRKIEQVTSADVDQRRARYASMLALGC